MKRKSLLVMLLVALFVPLAMNAQTRTLKKSINGLTQLEMKAPAKAMPTNPMLSQLEPAKEAALEELNGRGGRAVGDYNLVTASQDDWSGTYVLAYVASTTQARVMTGRGGSGTSTYGTGTLFTMTDNTLSASDVGSYAITIAADGNYYTIKFGNYYLGYSGSGNYLRFSTNTPTANTYRWTIAYSNSTLTITNANSTTRQIKWNSATNGLRFACYTSGQQNISLFKLDDGCSAPEDFAATSVTTTTATFSWTETGTSDTWVIFYMAEDDTETSYEIADTNPYTLTGLDPNTVYYAEVVPYCGDLDQESEVIEFSTEDLPCPQPSDLSVSDITMNSATASWTVEADSYTLRYRTAASTGEATFFDDFEDASLNSWQWTTYTNGDAFSGYGWFAYSPASLFSSGSLEAYSGDICAISLSYGNSSLSADNWLVTPQVELGGTLIFHVNTYATYPDSYEVLLSTSGNATTDFTVTLREMAAASGGWEEVSIDLSSYAGQTGYIAIHHVSENQFYLFVDDFGIYGQVNPAGEWVTITNVTSPYTIPGLDPETTYEWQVQGDCGDDGESLWSAINTFTSGSACDAPTGLTATNVTNNSADLSWTGNTDAYNVQYRVVNPTEPATVILNVPSDIWGDGTGYQLLLDADHNTYGTTIPTSGAFTAGTFEDFEYTIPEDAECDASTSTIVISDSQSITIPAGVYDYVFLNPYPDDGTYYIASNNGFPGRGDDYEFEAGKTYEFTLSVSTNDYITLTLTADWTTVSNVTNPYTLSNLDSNTQYEVQVQGVDCDGDGGTSEWSASAYFTTLEMPENPVESITAADVTVNVGETATITPTVLPADADNPAVSYESADEAIATVDATGVVTGVAAGNTTITISATDGSGVTATINVTVNNIPVESITASDITMVNGETATITATVLPANATNASLTYTSNNTSIATVDAEGVVTGVGVGETTITIASVSNPEITTDITVTVTSDPNAVQFSMVVPATATPGDVITVEAYMAAPTAGTYDGFTSLGVHLYYDNTAFEHTADPTYGPVGNSCYFHVHSYPNDTTVRVAFVQPAGTPTTTTGLMFSMEFTVLDGAQIGSTYTFYVEPMDAANFVCNYNNGETATRIPYEYVPSEVLISRSYIKDITGYGTSTGGYYLIASPVVEETTPSADNGFLTDAYDLYYFEQNPTDDLEWRNYKASSFNIANGQGYLYASQEDTRLVFTGTPYSGNGEIELVKVDGVSFAGWNLVGNPFTEIAYLEGGFYTMNGDASEIVAAENNSVEAMEGVFVIAENDGDVATFSTTEPDKSRVQLVMNLTKNRGTVVDRAILSFGEGRQLPKFQLRESSTKVYIPQEGNDYAMVNAESNMGELPLSFKAENSGSYTLDFSADNVSFNYLHLIDNKTGKEVDLLETPSYSFEASTTDYANRFKLVFATGESTEDNFAFFSNGSFVISNEGVAMLQVIDVTGRILKNEQISGSANVSVNAAPGVYMLRLVNGDNVKVQKVVVK